MVVVADSSPLIVLVNIGHVGVLPTLFGEVVIPPAVLSELHSANRPAAVRNFVAQPPSWLLERAPSKIEPITGLHAGELAAISLALELRADLLLIDDLSGRKAAADRKIPLAGTIGVLELAADQSLLDLRDAFDEIKKTDFWISHELLDQRLGLYLAKKSRG
jgi:predicted nucleic acid-binding protein